MANPVGLVANAVHLHIQARPDRILFPPFLVIKKLAAKLELVLLQLQAHAISLQVHHSESKSNEEALKRNSEMTKQSIRNAMRQLIASMVAWTQHTEISDSSEKNELLLVLCDLSKLCVQGFVQQSVSDGQLSLSPEDLNMLLLAFGDLSKSAIVEECVNLMASNKVTFPWKKYYLEGTLDQKFKKLQRYEANISVAPFIPHNVKFDCNNGKEPFLPFTFEGGSCLLISSDADYWDMDILTDYFTEKPRMQARRMLDKKSISERWPDRTLLTEMARAAFESDETKQHGLCTLSLRESLYKCANECTQFKASLAVSVFGLLQSKRVLDISAGWGDRLLAAIALDLERYVGADPNTALKAGHDAMMKRFAPGKADRFKIIYAPFEDAELGLEKFDTIFTSPPFFDFEVYSNLPGQSVQNFQDQLSWTVDFLFLSLTKAWQRLSPEGYMAIHIADVFKTKVCEAMCLFCEWRLEKCKYLGLLGSAGSVSEKVRPIWVFQKVDSLDPARSSKAGNLLNEHYPQIHKRVISGAVAEKSHKRKRD